MNLYVTVDTRWLVVIGLTAFACQRSAESDRFELLFAGELTVVDMSHALSANSPYWPNPNGNPFTHDTLSAHPSGAPSMAAYSTPEHNGTHLDAPIHSREGLRSVDELHPRDLLGAAVVIDVETQSEDNSNYLLTKEDLQNWETTHGVIPPGAIVLLYTGWSKKWSDAEAYRNLNSQGQLQFPGFSEDAAEFLVGERDIKGIGIDNMSVDYGLSTDFPVHRIVNGSGKFHLENVANLHQLPPIGTYLIVAPIKIEGGSGGQVRIFGVVPPPPT